jgi:hypothetical protein
VIDFIGWVSMVQFQPFSRAAPLAWPIFSKPDGAGVLHFGVGGGAGFAGVRHKPIIHY